MGNNDELLALYNANRANQQFYMSQQWKITYNSILLMSVLLFIHKNYFQKNKIYFLLLIILITFLGLLIILNLHFSLKETKRIDKSLINENLKQIGMIINKNKNKRFYSTILVSVYPFIFLIILILGGIISSKIILLDKNDTCKINFLNIKLYSVYWVNLPSLRG